MSRPRLLDLYSCQGGAAKGYADAGFEVVGVDIDPQPRYPFEFHQADALEFVLPYGRDFDAVHASPPCQLYSKTHRIQKNDHPDLIGPTRAALEWLGLPWVIENVEDARCELRHPVTLCGAAFGLRTYRHRLFEAGGGFRLDQPPHEAHDTPLAKMGRRPLEDEFIHAVGNFSGVQTVRDDYGVDWMDRNGIKECIPPAYAEFVGRQLLGHIAARTP